MFVVDGFEVLLPENREAKRAMRGPLLLEVETEDSASDTRCTARPHSWPAFDPSQEAGGDQVPACVRRRLRREKTLLSLPLLSAQPLAAASRHPCYYITFKGAEEEGAE